MYIIIHTYIYICMMCIHDAYLSIYCSICIYIHVCMCKYIYICITIFWGTSHNRLFHPKLWPLGRLDVLGLNIRTMGIHAANGNPYRH